jgi:hypothetical protein
VLVVPRHNPGRGVWLDPCTAMCGYTPSFTKQKRLLCERQRKVGDFIAQIHREAAPGCLGITSQKPTLRTLFHIMNSSLRSHMSSRAIRGGPVSLVL